MSAVNFSYEGIGKVLLNGRLRVPRNQREYSWDGVHAEDLCLDLATAMREGNDTEE